LRTHVVIHKVKNRKCNKYAQTATENPAWLAMYDQQTFALVVAPILLLLVVLYLRLNYRVAQKWHSFLYTLISSNI